MPPAAPASRPRRWLPPLILLLGGTCFVLIWVLLALYLGKQAGWMALLGAVDVALVLRLAGMRPGPPRLIAAAAATALIIALAHWFIAASQVGMLLGLNPWESALKLGAHHAWTLITLANGGIDWICLLLSLPLAAWLSR